ncbi:MAG: GTP-binding DUF697 domain-containing protein [Succinivibrionaceae bacterium]|nr:GTP-binding DUF697 domain-containing protein [Succinivibrionaceae bacterium]
MTETNFSGRYQEEYQRLLASASRPSVLVAGPTGAGKSSLVNLVLGREIAKVGAGRPVTSGIKRYDHDLVNIYDSEGYETGEASQQRFKDMIVGFIDQQAGRAEDAINVIWYCVSAPSERLHDADILCVSALRAKGLQVAMVLTQVDCASERACNDLRAAISESLGTVPVFLSSTEPGLRLSPGVDDLYKWTRDRLPESLRLAFMSASNRDIAAKAERGRAEVWQHVTGAFATGFLPIPTSDAPVLLANQMGMLARLSALWGIDVDLLLKLVSIESLLPLAGKTLAGNVLKLFPGVGTAVGGVINGMVAAGVTFGVGMAFNESCRLFCEAQLGGKRVSIADFFGENFRQAVQRYIEEYRNKGGRAP